ncbi:RNA polymerase II CTD NL1 interacting like phosphatase [Cryptosporidium bovis]|uniref:RNA polymerase II CTD NL1 interacting like phosphatase n=1 Tax=Cryptosporidium bovis TaxID=310047 RepID=UPI00351A0AE8|nr:RNA polymerase II CTD NL1 interacting like phosphatase [Cryptosporidium bovis]
MFNALLSCNKHRDFLNLTCSFLPASQLFCIPFFTRRFYGLNSNIDFGRILHDSRTNSERRFSTNRVTDENGDEKGSGFRLFLGTGVVIYAGYILRNRRPLKNIGELNNKFERFNEWSYAWVLENVVNRLFPQNEEEPLLPDFDKLGYPENLPTLVIGLRGTICDYSHSKRNGWGVIKRPGVDKFFDILKHYYEIVIWSDESFPIPQEIVHKWNLPVIGVLDKNQFTKKNGKYFKNLNRLGRNLERVILIDNESDSVSFQSDNSIVLPKYQGSPFDNELESITDLLKAAALQPGDIKSFIKSFSGENESIAARFNEYKKSISKKSNDCRKLSKFLPK